MTIKQRVRMCSSILFVLAAFVVAGLAQGPLTNLMNLRGRTDSSGNLYVLGATGSGQTPLTPLANLRGRTDSSGSLYVNCTSGCGGTFTGADGFTAQTFSSTPATGIWTEVINAGGANKWELKLNAGYGPSWTEIGNEQAARLGSHLITYAIAAPAVTNTSSNSCGTSAATLAGTSSAGRITVGSVGGTSCTVTPPTAWDTAPACIANNETTGNLLRATATTSAVVIAGVMVAGDKLTYVCLGY